LGTPPSTSTVATAPPTAHPPPDSSRYESTDSGSCTNPRHRPVSTSGQLLDRQQHALAEAGCLRIFADKLSGKNADRPELAACLDYLDYLRPGDTLVVPSLDRLSRSLADLIHLVGTLRATAAG
jgi:hypothetical protein